MTTALRERGRSDARDEEEDEERGAGSHRSGSGAGGRPWGGSHSNRRWYSGDVPTGKEAPLERAVNAVFEPEEVPALEELVELPSATLERADVEACFVALDRRASALGLVIERHPDPAGAHADHRVYRTPAANADTPCIALVGHLDTVFPRALGFFGFRREGDTAYGPGVLDMKSGLVSVLFALRALRETDRPAFDRLALRFVVVSDEEVGSPSSKPLFDRLAKVTTEALVFEAGRTEDRLVTRRKGSGLWSVVAHGKASHAGAAHEAGVSAIHALALVIPRIEALTDYGRGVTVSVGLVEGGTAKNTVPERAAAHIDARFERMADVTAFEKALAGIASSPLDGAPHGWAPEKLRSVRLEVLGGVSRPPMERLAGTAALRERYERCASVMGLGVGEAPLQGGGSDANLLAAAGVPTLDGLGPYGRHFHETREHCSLESLRRRTVALAMFLAEVAARGVQSGT